MSEVLRQRRWSILVGLAAIVVVSLIAYIPALDGDFIWDDDAYVENNQALRSLSGLVRIWTDPGATPQYYPMVHTTYWIEYRLWGLSTVGYHLVNVLLHAIGATLLWRVLRGLAVPGAFVAALVFALHPVHVESVAWITERKNVLAGVFYFASALVYLAHERREAADPGKRGWKGYSLALLFFVLALLSKTVTCTLPAALLLVVWWKRRRVAWRDARALAPFFLIGLVFGLVTIVLERTHVGALGEPWEMSIVERALLPWRIVCFYAAKLVWPVQLTFSYPRWELDGSAPVQYLYPAAVIAALAALWSLRRRIGLGPLVGLLFFIGTLLPALGFFNVYPMRYSFVADHFQYLASVGLIAVGVAAGARLFERLAPRAKQLPAALAVGLLGVLGALTWQQCYVYQGLEVLWFDTLEKNPASWMASTNLGNLRFGEERYDEAIVFYRRAVEAKPDNVRALNGWGLALFEQGQYQRAEARFLQAREARPDWPDTYFNLGNAYRAQRRTQDAIGAWRKTLELNPEHFKARMSLGLIGLELGQPDLAIEHFEAALRIRPRLLTTHNNLADAYARKGDVAKAVAHWTLALEANPEWVAVLGSLAYARSAYPGRPFHDPAEAVRLAERACELTDRKDATSLHLLSIAYAADGRFAEAVEAATQALALAGAAGIERLSSELRRNIELFERGEPYTEPRR